jgi:choline monooxygenase
MDRIRTLTIDDDIGRAATLPGWVYGDPEVHCFVREQVFAKSWQLVADLDQVKAPGQVHPLVLLEGLLDQPLVLTRDRDDRLHCLSNVCTHRGMLVCRGDGVANKLRCPYHGRTFHLDGRFQSMPEFDGVQGFPSPADDLEEVPLGMFEKFLFASLAPSTSIEALVAPLRARCGWLPFRDVVFDPARSRDYLVQANWALYVDNYLEGFHIPYVHPGLAQVLNSASYRVECFDGSSLQLGHAADGEQGFDAPAGAPDHGARIAAYYWWLFPNTMFNLYPWGVSVNVVRPLAVDRTRVSFLTYVWDASKLDHGAGAALDRVEREDEVVVESVQRGVRSRFYERGRYSPAREPAVHHFHRLLVAALRETAS